MNALFAGFWSMIWVIILVLLLLGAGAGFAYRGNILNAAMLTENLSAPLDGADTAEVDLNAGDGNLTIDRLAGGEQVLVRGELQYLERQGKPTWALDTSNGQARFTLRGGGAGQPWFRFPWAACNGATEWRLHLNPAVAFDLTAHSGGGNVKLDLAGMRITRVVAGTGGGNMDVVLPDNAANLNVEAKTGAGNVTVEIGGGVTGSGTVNASSGAGNVVVRIPTGIAAKVHAGSGLGKVIVDPRFSLIDGDTYQSPDFDSAADRVEITVHSGAGNVTVGAK